MAFSFFKKLTSKEQKQESHNGPHYYDLKVKQIVQETRDAISVVFENPEGGAISYKAGQFLTLIANVDGKEVRRCYSLCSSPFVDDNLAVTVKRVEKGLMSNWLPDHLQAGQTIKVMAPTGHFTTEFSKDKKRHLVMFAGGSGITPMMSLIKSLLSQEPDSIVSLIYCNRNIDSIIFKDELARMETKDQGRLHVI
ncbi:MAG: oxidoreductase, partial [Bacteroidetes bacterium]|nr:oxidoreductase [Bacteroidota bacterium]